MFTMNVDGASVIFTESDLFWNHYYFKFCGEQIKSVYREFLKMVEAMEIRDDDVWVVTLPRSGTTWTQELVWLVWNNFQFEEAKKIPLDLRSPCIELEFLLTENTTKIFELFDNLKSPRVFKSHLPRSLLPKQLLMGKGKTVYVCRNPADSLTSVHFLRKTFLHNPIENINEEFNAYLKSDLSIFNPFDHIIEFFKLRHEPQIYFTSYERLKHNLSLEIQNVCKFLGKTITKAQMNQMLHHLSFDEMKKNPNVQMSFSAERTFALRNISPKKYDFVRRGEINGYNKDLSPETSKRVEKWVEENCSKKNVSLRQLLDY